MASYYASWERAQEVRTIGDTRRLRMKRRGLWAACVVVLVGVGVLAVGAGYANDEDAAGAKCSEATLHGRYLLAYDGFEIEGKNQGPFAVAGHAVFDGNGNVDQVFSSNFNGQVFRKVPITGTYTVKADCTGTSTFPDGVTHLADLFIAPDGSMYTFVQIKPPEQVASGFTLRGTAKRVGD
jgi:hypothetical protein